MSANPFQAPETSDLEVDPHPEGQLSNMPFKELKKLYTFASGCRALIALWILGVGLAIRALVFRWENLNPGLRPILLGICIAVVVTLVGLYTKKEWARKAAIALGIIQLTVGVIQLHGLWMLFGACAAVGFSSTKALYGPNCLSFKEVKGAYKAAKKARK